MTRLSLGSSASLRAKLSIGFGATILLSLILGGTALDRMADMNQVVVDIRDKALVHTSRAGDIATALSAMRREEARMMMADSDEERAVILAQLKSVILKVGALRQDYEILIDPGEERDRYTKAFDTVWPLYKTDDA